ncbi:DUF1858 domain-containing protein [Candidatus Peregrinibacteria bacterium]|nr:DUF1858 domain-containing protein [Candidatus Peregrinibacteria bacterium]MBI3816046.1 DUF1858 domain-containing protein [Candidatus Peregrinibacteria bacterium]
MVTARITRHNTTEQKRPPSSKRASTSPHPASFSAEVFEARKRKKSVTSKKKSPGSDAIHRDMPVADIVALCPEAQTILAEYGLHCFGCAGSALETLKDGCRGHGFSDEDIDELVDDIGQLVAAMPSKPAALTLTLSAARAIRDVAEKEGRGGEGLCVIADGQGGFCMEFRKESEGDEKVFTNREEPDVRIFASSLTLKRIGGATIDFREGRFKLDLLDHCDCAAGSCSCAEGIEN